MTMARSVTLLMAVRSDADHSGVCSHNDGALSTSVKESLVL